MDFRVISAPLTRTRYRHTHDYYDDDHFTWKEGQGYVHTVSGGGARGHKDKFLPLDPNDSSAQFGPYVPGRDGPVRRCGPTELGLVRSLIYPDGFAAEGDGGVKLVKGGTPPIIVLHMYMSRYTYT